MQRRSYNEVVSKLINPDLEEALNLVADMRDEIIKYGNMTKFEELRLKLLPIKSKLEYKLQKGDSCDYYFDVFIKRCIDWGTDRIYKLEENEEKATKYDILNNNFHDGSNNPIEVQLYNTQQQIKQLSDDNKQLQEELYAFTHGTSNLHKILNELESERDNLKEMVLHARNGLELWRLGHIRDEDAYCKFKEILGETKA